MQPLIIVGGATARSFDCTLKTLYVIYVCRMLVSVLAIKSLVRHLGIGQVLRLKLELLGYYWE